MSVLLQGMKRKRYVGSPHRMGSSNGSRFSYDAPPDTPSAPQGKRRPEARRFYPSCLTGEAPEIRNTGQSVGKPTSACSGCREVHVLQRNRLR